MMIRATLAALALGAVLVAFPAATEAQAQAATLMAEGAQVYGKQCVRCHNARSPMERTDREWLTIVNHMRARANLTRAEAQALVFFLQATNGDGNQPVVAAPSEEDGPDDAPEGEGSGDEGEGGEEGRPEPGG